MIRAALTLIVFLGVTLVLILMQPSSDRSLTASLPETVDAVVTRAQITPDPLETLSDSLGTAATLAPELPQIEPVALQASVAAAIRPAAPLKPATQPMQATAPTATVDNLEQLIVSALTQGQSEDYIDALVNDAAVKGTVDVPQSLITQDGRVDTASLLAALSNPAYVSGALGARNYVVQPGDSLASIAYRFYGSTAKATDIYSANRDLLQLRNQVEVGQQLVIPAQ